MHDIMQINISRNHATIFSFSRNRVTYFSFLRIAHPQFHLITQYFSFSRDRATKRAIHEITHTYEGIIADDIVMLRLKDEKGQGLGGPP